MVTLDSFGPFFDLPDGGPFVMKSMIPLKMAGVPFVEDRGGLFRAPKGKSPFIDEFGEIVAVSPLIRLHVERKYGYDFDMGLTPEQRAIAWAAEKLCEDHICWRILCDRWGDDANFAQEPARRAMSARRSPGFPEKKPAKWRAKAAFRGTVLHGCQAV
ncbi:glutathione S-transferase-like protein [Rhodoblastus acidophilus]|uniref:Glutathione S-transferase-like protein n=2 Tax=Rhodoblastus acidophilus TaxID=1074 RepID=A0A212RU42_RHOAC|nr:hypothetical protein CKO16_14360 [Rhodoblastus acidophilus]RAI23131.1 hypothetical protein CH337_03635 [Rhodoblastus acidophilus]SNB76245.1 glutathione S-transferase-like protein [Rhodoblastus acidophilus]